MFKRLIKIQVHFERKVIDLGVVPFEEYKTALRADAAFYNIPETIENARGYEDAHIEALNTGPFEQYYCLERWPQQLRVEKESK